MVRAAQGGSWNGIRRTLRREIFPDAHHYHRVLGWIRTSTAQGLGLSPLPLGYEDVRCSRTS